MTKKEYAELMDRVINPLTIIPGLAQLPLSEKCDKKDCCEVIINQVERIHSYLRNIKIEED